MLKISRKGIAVLTVVIILAGALIYLMMRGGERREVERATIDDLLATESVRRPAPYDMVIVDYDSPFFALVATPAAIYYKGDEVVEKPLLVAGLNPETQEGGISKSVLNFIKSYPEKRAMLVGDFSAGEISILKDAGAETSLTFPGVCVKSASLQIARSLWVKSDGAIIVEKSLKGYTMALNTVPIASYLNIPVIVTRTMDSDVMDVLEALGVKYVIICGDVEPTMKYIRIGESETAHELLALGSPSRDGTLKSIFSDRLKGEPEYIALASPRDVDHPKVLERKTFHFEGTVESQDTGSTSDPSLNPNAPKHHLTIPDGWKWVNVKLSGKIRFTESPIPGRSPEDDGQRCYVYFGYDADSDGVLINDKDSKEDHLEFFIPSLAYKTLRDASGWATEGWAYGEEPIYNAEGNHTVEIMATLHYTPSDQNPPKTTYKIDVTLERLDRPNYPLMHNISSIAPYLAVHHRGIVLAEDYFTIYQEPLISQRFCGDPSETLNAYPEKDRTHVSGLLNISNSIAVKIKERLNELLKGLAGLKNASLEDLARAYSSRDQVMYLGIVADTNMIPMYYYPARSQGAEQQEGYGIAGDLFYSSIDADPASPPWDVGGKKPTGELAVGRVDGWDAQDVSALVGRVAFYYRIIGSFQGIRGRDWKDSAMNTFGSKIPVGSSKTVTEKLDKSFHEAGFAVDSYHDVALSDSRLSREIYEKSNFIYFCAHGFFYWFVPPGHKPTAVGGAFYVANVIDMNFGPSVIFGSSCVTGKIDGIQPYNAVSLAFLHSGMNTYVGASRLSWGALAYNPFDKGGGEEFGAYLGLLFYGYLTGYVYNREGGLIFEGVGDLTVGEALMNAKNLYSLTTDFSAGDENADTLEEFNLHGDPAFNPYEPNHNG
ncbi:MAG: hypothetical protein J7L88_03705 [Thermoplasmata archaeon]|nr:hypothetical protein [Thermoplasmata archaeon]